MVTILDGGMGGELIAREVIPRDKLWSAQALLDAPDRVSELHRDYIDAGARIIITNSYSTIPSYLAKGGLQDRYIELTQQAGKIARKVADSAHSESGTEIIVAGCLPPLDESYRPDLTPRDEVAVPIYTSLANALAPFVDVFWCETMSNVRESVNAVSVARSVSADKPIYLSWTLAEEPGSGLRSGEEIAEAFEAVQSFDVTGYLFNCTSPEAISHGLMQMRKLTDKPIGAYPNRFSVPEGWTLDNQISTRYRNDLDVNEYVAHALRWRDLGASIIGGCCGIGPEYIAALARALPE